MAMLCRKHCGQAVDVVQRQATGRMVDCLRDVVIETSSSYQMPLTSSRIPVTVTSTLVACRESFNLTLKYLWYARDG